LKKINAITNPLVKKRLERVSYRKKEPKYYKGLIASSDIDSYAMAAMYYPIKYENVWITGLPRNDFLIKNLNNLPSYLCSEINTIRQIKKGKRLITYAPTYRQTVAVKDSSYYQFSKEEINELKKILKKHNAILGFRMHYFRNNKTLFNIEDYIDNEYFFNLGHEKFSDIASVIRESDIIISDYSSVFVEAMYLTKPVIGFVYDVKHYRENQNGLLYDFDLVFPGPIVQNFASLIIELDNELTYCKQIGSERYNTSKKFFYKFIDDKNSERVVEKVRQLLM
jgi:CDP-glycerol glycerophosphotransferase